MIDIPGGLASIRLWIHGYDVSLESQLVTSEVIVVNGNSQLTYFLVMYFPFCCNGDIIVIGNAVQVFCHYLLENYYFFVC